MNLKQLREKRATILREAESLKGADGSFKDDQTRAAFDAKMGEIDALDAQIRTAEQTERANPGTETPEQARAAERTRQTEIRNAVRVAGLDAAVADEMCGRDISIDAARAEIFEKLAARSNTTAVRNQTIEMGEAARDKFLRGATNWLILRGGAADIVATATKTDRASVDPGEFRGLSLLDLARHVLEANGRSTRGMDKMQVVGEAFTRSSLTGLGTSDFSVLLENAMYKVLQAAYRIAPDTWRRFCAVSSVVDFRTNPRYRMGNFSALDAKNEFGEYKNKAISDAEKATIAATTKGNIVAITREAIVNDDMNFFATLPARLGRAAALSVEADVYALIAANPNMPYDSTALFHANHGNLTTQASLSAAAIDADRVAMASQKEPGGNDYIDLRPAILVVPVGLGGQARVINTSQYDPDTLANKSQMKPNVVAGLFRDVVDTPRLSGTTRYLFADPAIAPVIEVAFLDGQDQPVLEAKDGWRVDGTELRVRLDYGVAAVDHRGAVKNLG